MNEKTKQETKTAQNLKEISPNDKTDSWVNDQNERGYYYDDAHGYEVYSEDKEDENDDEI